MAGAYGGGRSLEEAEHWIDIPESVVVVKNTVYVLSEPKRSSDTPHSKDIPLPRHRYQSVSVRLGGSNPGNMVCTAISDESLYICARRHDSVVLSLKIDEIEKQQWKSFKLTPTKEPFLEARSMAVAANNGVDEVSLDGWRRERDSYGRSRGSDDEILVSTFKLVPTLETTCSGEEADPISALDNEYSAMKRSLDDDYYGRLHFVDGEPLVLGLSGGVWQRTGKDLRYISGAFKGHQRGALWWSSLLTV
ncbi:hypothetical protein KFL_005770050 [Klebsormidium nitens]|uniref:Uncharacterized protein n=1 Tax=Klebsormidium nitens TaxID=105231 RepID=A0A1Y1IP75_KLENI|nr:hypothetical protein KFL_005770050 [Klebsormidium nitens]|eukprot:GAQ89918.1 hypothetical protein KFL_005770050 [Klebsormidium nitens]